MATQTYANHRKFVPLFHYSTFPIAVLTVIGSVVNLVMSWGDHERLYSASLIVVLSIVVVIFGLLGRIFALRAQDRAIRAEENLRHFAATGKLLDDRLGTKQVVALRFASDGEFVAMARRAAEEALPPEAIKRSIKNWRPDTYRV